MYQSIKDAANHAEDIGGLIAYHSRRRGISLRVTHTFESALKMLSPIAYLFRKLEAERKFCKRFENALYQSQIGATEISYSQDGKGRLGPRSIFIQGSFDIDKLRDFILVNKSDETIQLEVSGPKK